MSNIIEKEATASDEDIYNDLIVEDNLGFECEICEFNSDTMEILLKHLGKFTVDHHLPWFITLFAFYWTLFK